MDDWRIYDASDILGKYWNKALKVDIELLIKRDFRHIKTITGIKSIHTDVVH